MFFLFFFARLYKILKNIDLFVRSHLFDNFESTNNFMDLSFRTLLLIPALILSGSPALPAVETPDLSMAEKFLERGRILYENSDYDSLPYYYLTAKAIFQQNDRPVQTAACLLGMSDYYRLNNNLDRSAATLDSADKYIGVHLGLDSESWADALNTRAKLLTRRSQYDPAIKLLNQSLRLLEELGAAPEKTARTEHILGASYLDKGDLQKAQEYLMEAYITYQQITAQPSAEMGRLLYNIGVLHNCLGNHREWKAYITKSIANDIAYFGPDYPDLARAYSILSGYFIDYGMSDSALYYLEKSEEIERKAFGEGHGGLVILYIQRARIFRLVGDYDRALEYYQQAFGILQKNENTKGYQGRSLYLNMGSLYKSLGDYASAEKVLLNLLDLEGKVHPTNMALYYYYLGDIQRLLGNYAQSEKYFRSVFKINDQFLAPDYHRKVFDYLGYGILLDSLKMYNQAGQYYSEAVRIAEKNYGFHHPVTAGSLKSTGDHFCLAGEQDKALAYYQQSIFSLVPDYDVAGFASNPPPGQINDNLFYLGLLKGKASVLRELAGTASDLGDRKQRMMAAFSSYQTSIGIIDKLRNSYLSDRSKLYLSENERDTYEKCVESAYQCYELYSDPEYLKQAFMVAEKGKYATLLSVLQREKTIVLAGIPDSIVQMDASLRKELSFQQELLLESQEDTLNDTVATERYQVRIFQLRDRIERLNKRLETEYPAYYDLLYNQQVLGPDAIRKKLGSSEKLLEYFYGGSYLYRFEIYRQGMDCHRIPLGEAFDQELAVIENYLSRNFLVDTLQVSHEMFLATAHSLYGQLIPPSPAHSRLIIIPEGRLSYFPFDILVSEPVEQFSGLFNQVPFLIKDHSIRYGYSATLMERLEKGERIRLNKLIAFAPGYGSASDTAASAGEAREMAIDRTRLRSLPGSIKEVMEIGRISGGRAFTGTTASEALFKKLAGDSHIIHLATHAFLDDADPLKSKLVFSEGNAGEDGFLNVYEIYNLDLVARMVVLSACNTGAGRLNRGEGIMSLARAFIYAGVPNIVMTLWTVSDRQSYELMVGYYRQLIAGRSTETALRRAKLKYLEQATPSYQHPQYWAGYILVGNPDKLFIPRLWKWIVPLLLVTIFLAAGFILKRSAIGRRPG
jgi:CHAT domain-containing protein/tetratricopeptide (TPR) repeat protein